MVPVLDETVTHALGLGPGNAASSRVWLARTGTDLHVSGSDHDYEDDDDMIPPRPNAAPPGLATPPEPNRAIASEPEPKSRRKSARCNNACTRCRRQKIRCLGGDPCTACAKRKLSCHFDGRGQRVTVTRGYIDDLERQAAVRDERRSAAVPGPSSSAASSTYTPHYEDDSASETADIPPLRPSRQRQSRPRGKRRVDEVSQRTRSDPDASDTDVGPETLTNPLSSGKSSFTIAPYGRLFWLGTSSNWAFARRILTILHDHIYRTPLPTSGLLFDGSINALPWDGYRSSAEPEMPILPTLDHALYLINAARFRLGPTYHVFDEDSFMANVRAFYDQPVSERTSRDDLWFCQFLLILAFGTAFCVTRYTGEGPPGMDLFARALYLLPHQSALSRDPMISVEILCLISMYFNSLHHRMESHLYICQAVRLAMGQAMHTDMPSDFLGEMVVERSRRCWWTVYLIDHEMTSLGGMPVSINDADLCFRLPSFGGSKTRSDSLHMHIQLARIMAYISRTVYGAGAKLDSRFLSSTKSALEKLAGLADELQEHFPMPSEPQSTGVDRVAACLNLRYNQCIVLAVRPLCFCSLKFRLERSPDRPDLLNSSKSSKVVRNLIQTCVDSCLQLIRILECLKGQFLLETFLSIDMDCAFMSIINILVASWLDPDLVRNSARWLESAYAIYDDFIASGNRVAMGQKAELQKIGAMLCKIPRDGGVGPPTAPHNTPLQQREGFGSNNNMYSMPHHPPMTNESQTDFGYMLNDNGLDTQLTATHIMDMANLIDIDDEQWISQMVLDGLE